MMIFEKTRNVCNWEETEILEIFGKYARLFLCKFCKTRQVHRTLEKYFFTDVVQV